MSNSLESTSSILATNNTQLSQLLAERTRREQVSKLAQNPIFSGGARWAAITEACAEKPFTPEEQEILRTHDTAVAAEKALSVAAERAKAAADKVALDAEYARRTVAKAAADKAEAQREALELLRLLRPSSLLLYPQGHVARTALAGLRGEWESRVVNVRWPSMPIYVREEAWTAAVTAAVGEKELADLFRVNSAVSKPTIDIFAQKAAQKRRY